MKVRIDADKAIVKFKTDEERKVFLREVYVWDEKFKKQIKTMIIRVLTPLGKKRIK